tara:strand:+ start:248 stop:424 length:177 start_codon:yes stop_codon:yes gene_type:complete
VEVVVKDMLDHHRVVVLVDLVVVHLIEVVLELVVQEIHQQIQIIHKFKDIRVEILPHM